MTASSIVHLLLVATFTTCVRTNRVQQATAHLQSNVVTGSVVFTEDPDGQVWVTGTLMGLTQGSYGFHVHQLGDVSNDCQASGPHFNPEGVTHGGRDHEVRHLGDLGNVDFDEYRIAHINFMDRLLALNGDDSIVGRTLVLHERFDDYGLTSHEDSLTTGNAGARVACGVIGITMEIKSGGATVSRTLNWLVPLLILQLLRLY